MHRNIINASKVGIWTLLVVSLTPSSAPLFPGQVRHVSYMREPPFPPAQQAQDPFLTPTPWL